MRKLFLLVLSTASLSNVSWATNSSIFVKNGNLIQQNTTNSIEKSILASTVRIYSTAGYICSGSLATDNNGNAIVITAAHCALNMGNLQKMANTAIPNNENVVNPENLFVYTHYTNSAKTAQKYSVNHVYVNPDAFYGVGLKGDGNLDIENLAKVNDVAILTLSQNMSNIPTMYLSTSVPAKGTSVYIAGYGADDGEIGKGTSTTGFGTADLLRYAKIITADLNGNALDIGAQSSVTGEIKTYWATSCQGDSGGPTFSIDNGVVTQVGITSFGPANEAGCPNIGAMSSVMDVSQFNSWLLSSYKNSTLSR